MSKLFTFTYPAVFGRSQAPSAFSCHGIRMQHRLGVRKIEKEVRDLATGMRIIHLPLILKSCQPASNHPTLLPQLAHIFSIYFFFLNLPMHIHQNPMFVLGSACSNSLYIPFSTSSKTSQSSTSQ